MARSISARVLAMNGSQWFKLVQLAMNANSLGAKLLQPWTGHAENRLKAQ
jgi:hypothetical protein